jgi:WhiB family redox-sensing transcriptional regulator
MTGAATDPGPMSAGTAAVWPEHERPDWRDRAACRNANPELFFPDDKRPSRAQVMAAKLICGGCPVSATCLSWALSSGQEAGIWGGLTEDERRRLSRVSAQLPAVEAGRRYLT